jgi:hypothetical protein
MYLPSPHSFGNWIMFYVFISACIPVIWKRSFINTWYRYNPLINTASETFHITFFRNSVLFPFSDELAISFALLFLFRIFRFCFFSVNCRSVLTLPCAPGGRTGRRGDDGRSTALTPPFGDGDRGEWQRGSCCLILIYRLIWTHIIIFFQNYYKRISSLRMEKIIIFCFGPNFS